MIRFNNLDIIQGSGISKTKLVQLLPTSTEIESNGSIEVTIDYSTIPQAKITADDNIVDYITLKQVGNKLTIGLKDDISISPKMPLQVHLTLPLHTKSLTLHGSGSIKGSSICDQLEEVKISGSGNILVETLRSIFTSLSVSGSGSITVEKGEIAALHCDVNGGGKITCIGADIIDGVIVVNGSGKITIKVKNTLDAKVNGSGKITYSCDGTVKQKVNGSGKIIKE